MQGIDSDQLCRILATLRVLEDEPPGIEVTELRRCFSETGATGFELDQAFAGMVHMMWISVTPSGKATITKRGKKFVKKFARLHSMSKQRYELN